MYTAVKERVSRATSPLSFTLLRAGNGGIDVAEKESRAGGSFPDLSSALRFVEAQCRAEGCPVSVRFDASLAMIRAAC